LSPAEQSVRTVVAIAPMPDATERWSPLGADRALVVDLGGASRVESAASSLACEVLASLPCPSIAFGPAELPIFEAASRWG